MRMDPLRQTLTAADIVNTYSYFVIYASYCSWIISRWDEQRLVNLFFDLAQVFHDIFGSISFVFPLEFKHFGGEISCWLDWFVSCILNLIFIFSKGKEFTNLTVNNSKLVAVFIKTKFPPRRQLWHRNRIYFDLVRNLLQGELQMKLSGLFVYWFYLFI